MTRLIRRSLCPAVSLARFNGEKRLALAKSDGEPACKVLFLQLKPARPPLKPWRLDVSTTTVHSRFTHLNPNSLPTSFSLPSFSSLLSAVRSNCHLFSLTRDFHASHSCVNQIALSRECCPTEVHSTFNSLPSTQVLGRPHSFRRPVVCSPSPAAKSAVTTSSRSPQYLKIGLGLGLCCATAIHHQNIREGQDAGFYRQQRTRCS